MTTERAEPQGGDRSAEARSRLALLALASGLGAAVAYVALRGYVYLRVGPMVPVLSVRTSSVAYYQALAIAAVLGTAWGLFVHERTQDAARRENIERALERAALPIVLGATVLAWIWP